ncbi:MAG TPA: arylsulfatase [Candidatus Binatia bacterium]|nr:arylsulfatase [Candidatus Binatia bacterium]
MKREMLSLLLFTCVAAAPSGAQQVSGTLGSPSAATTIDGKQIPAPDLPFGGEIKRNALESKPWWPPRIVPPKDAPNILLIMTDDTGFGAASTFGGVIPMATLDKLAQQGLRYTNMNSTALCSPSRAALISGRNHHSMGFGVVSEQATGFPGYDSFIPKDKATVGRILKDNGYATSWFGKNHNTPAFQASQAGPFDQWPLGMGFEYFYGFVGGDTSQWQPNLFRNTTPIYPYVGNPKWNLITAMADDAIHWMNQLNDIDPEKPFFLYYVPGATHAPHHPTPEWIKKISDLHLFDNGWNALRDQIFANQKKLGVIPQDAQMTPWPDLLKKWDDVPWLEKKMFIREANVYAAYLAYTDHEIGRVIQAVADMGKLDNTLIIYIVGDNGSSAEGGMDGTPNEVAALNGVHLPMLALAEYYESWGSDRTYPHMAIPWTWAFDTPFSWTKQIASHFGGVRQGTVISWPGHIKDAGGIRNQFSHFIDIVPTILEVTGIPAPATVDGIPQKPIEGTSLAYTFDKANADAPARHTTQYFEMFADRAIYHDGWIASTKVTRPPWEIAGATNPDPANNATWELYDLTKDWTQHDDVAAANPAKLKELQDIFWSEAEKYQVLPLDSSVAPRVVVPKPSLAAGKSTFTYSGTMTGIPGGDAPSLLNTSYTITADIGVPKGGAEGMINTNGGRFAGYGFYVLKGKPVFLWNLFGFKRIRWEGPKLAPGKHTLEFDFKYDGLGVGTLAFNSVSGIGQGGTGTLKVDGKVVSTQKMEHTIPIIIQFDETFDVGADTGTSVADKEYQPPFAFTGTLDKLTIKIDRPKLSPEDEKRLREGTEKAADNR